MRRVFALLLIAGMILSVGCSPEEQAEPVVELTSASIVQFLDQTNASLPASIMGMPRTE